jgi:hypothetical protein
VLQFIHLVDDTLIAIDRIGAVRHASDHHGWLLFDRDGRELGQAESGFSPFDLEPTTIVPAAAGETATTLFIDEDVEHRPERSDVQTARCQIVAWRVFTAGDWALPILVGEPEGGMLRVTLVRRPDGRMADPMGESWANLNEATTAFLAEAQEKWDREENEAVKDDVEVGEPSVH